MLLFIYSFIINNKQFFLILIYFSNFRVICILTIALYFVCCNYYTTATDSLSCAARVAAAGASRLSPLITNSCSRQAFELATKAQLFRRTSGNVRTNSRISREIPIKTCIISRILNFSPCSLHPFFHFFLPCCYFSKSYIKINVDNK